MRYEQPQPEPNRLGPAEMILGFIVCILSIAFIFSLLF
jgi:hypothetical protein